MRVVVIGGDERGARAAWPEEYEVVHFGGSKQLGKREIKRACRVLKAGHVEFIVVMTKFVGHDMMVHLRKFKDIPKHYHNGGFDTIAATLRDVVARIKRAA